MASISTVAAHPQVQKIVAALAANQPYRDISAWTEPKVTPSALCRFKRNALAAAGGTWRNKGATSRNQVQPAARQAEQTPIYDTEVLTDAPMAATEAALTAHASPFRQQLAQLRDVTMESIERARTAVRVDKDGNTIGQDMSAIAPLLAQGHRNVELLGKATGELEQAQTNITNNLAVVMNLRRDETPQ